MADFVNEFWNWFVIISTIISVLACWWLVLSQSKKGQKSSTGDVESTGHIWDEDLQELNNQLPRWWLYMFYITLYFGSAYLILYPGLGDFQGLLGWSQVKEYEDEVADAEKSYGPIFNKFVDQDLKTVAADPEAQEIGKRLYSTYCTQCHGSDARGARGYPNLVDNDSLYGSDPDTIKTSIMNGRNGVMPAWEQTLGNEGVFSVTAYIESFRGKEIDPVIASQGKTIYMTTCAACHGAEATGTQALGAPNLKDDIWLYGGSNKRIMESVAKGRQGQMPPHGEFLGEAKVHLLAAYIYRLSNNNNP
ncbi:MAG: cytochrome-c oxidase, cbb3-type subunit III [Gammaproteobacteria bacterium]